MEYPRSIWSHNPIPGGCVLYLPLWNPACWGSTFKSIDPYGHVCTRTGGVMSGDGFTADGDDKIDCGSAIIPAQTFSIIVSSKISDITEHEDLVSQWKTAEANRFNIGFRSNDVGTGSEDYISADRGGNQKATTSNDSIAVDTPYQFAVTANSGTLITHLNGAVNGVGGALGGDVYQGTNTLIGTYATGYFWIGVISEVWIYNRTLSLGEIAYTYNQTKGRFT